MFLANSWLDSTNEPLELYYINSRTANQHDHCMDKCGYIFVPCKYVLMLSRPYSVLTTLPPTIRQILSTYSKTGPPEHTSAVTTVHGWIKSVRRQKNVSFAVVNDGTTLQGLQAVFIHPEAEQASLMKRLTTGTSVRLDGMLIESLGKGQDYELKVEKMEVLGDCEPEVIFIRLFHFSLS